MSTSDRARELKAVNATACPVVTSIEEIGTTWRLLVLDDLREGEKRFNELKRSTGARSKTLSEVLDALLEHDLVEKRMEEAAPVAVYYELTPKGRSLVPVLEELAEWGREWVEGADEDPRPVPDAGGGR